MKRHETPPAGSYICGSWHVSPSDADVRGFGRPYQVSHRAQEQARAAGRQAVLQSCRQRRRLLPLIQQVAANDDLPRPRSVRTDPERALRIWMALSCRAAEPSERVVTPRTSKVSLTSRSGVDASTD
jgi:hypothetical protein